jgi:hypothetical protein
MLPPLRSPSVGGQRRQRSQFGCLRLVHAQTFGAASRIEGAQEMPRPKGRNGNPPVLIDETVDRPGLRGG